MTQPHDVEATQAPPMRVDAADQLTALLNITDHLETGVREALERGDIIGAVKIVRRCFRTTEALIHFGHYDRLADARNRLQAALNKYASACRLELVKRLLKDQLSEADAAEALQLLSAEAEGGWDWRTEIDKAEKLCAA